MFLILFLIVVAAGSPPQAAALLQKGLVELQHGEAQAARDDLKTASELDGANPYVWSALAEAYARNHELPEAASAAQKAESNGGENPIVGHALALYYSQVGQYAKAARAEERYASSPKADKLAKSRVAGWYLAAGDTAKALALAKAAGRDDTQAAFELAQLFLRQQQFVSAAELLSDSLTSHPDDPQLTLALGVARYGERRFDEAITAFLRVIRLDAQIEQSYLFLGRMLDQAGPHMDEIASDARSWAEKNPDKAGAQLLLAKVLLARDPSDTSAEALLRRSIALDGNNWEAHYQLGVFLETSRQYPAAAEALRRATELNSKEATPHYHLARVYDRLGNPQAAAAERDIHKRLVGAGKEP